MAGNALVEKTRASRVTLRVLAAIFGSLALALAASICIGRTAPISLSSRFALAHYLFVPFWVAAACVGFTARSAARAWAAYIVLTVLLAAVAILAGRS